MSDRKFRAQFKGMNISGIGSRQLKKLNKEYGKGNWNLTGGKGYAASGTIKQYGRAWGGYRRQTVYHKLPEPPKPAAAAPAPAPAPAEPAYNPASPPTLPVNEPQQYTGPSMEDIASKFQEQIAAMQQGFMQSMQQQQQMFQQMQVSQSERMEALQNQMMQAQTAQQQRPEVAGVKMAEGTGGTPMQIARRGVSGSFGRRGMRISSLNV